ncbi:MAG: 50S ribosomal protein L25/general stress protein Ctc [Jatrophihabitantaceae bacterium]
MSEVRLPAEPRSEFGKGGARRTRRAGKIPAVIYGHGADPRHVSLPAREFTNAIRHGGANVLLTLDFEGEEQLAIPKAIQRHAIKGTYDHVDLLAVRLGEKVTIDVPLTIVGTLVAGGLLAQEHTAVSVEAEATHLPTEIEVSLDGLGFGTQITAGDLKLPQGSTLAGDPEQVLLIVNEAPTEAELEAAGEGEPTEVAEVEAAETAEAGDAAEGATAEPPAEGTPAE